MSIEQAIATLAEAINAQTEALQRNTDISEKLLSQRGGDAGTKQTTPEKAETPDDSADDAAEAKKKAAAERKAKAAAERKAKAAAEADEADETEPEEAPATMKEVRDAAVRLKDKAGNDALEKAKKAFKIAKVKDLAEENYGAFVRHCETLLADAADDGDL